MFQCVHYFVDQHQKNRIWNVLWRTKLLLTLYHRSERRTFPARCCSDVDSCYFVRGSFFLIFPGNVRVSRPWSAPPRPSRRWCHTHPCSRVQVHQSELPHLLQQRVQIGSLALAELSLLSGEFGSTGRLLLGLLLRLLGLPHHLLDQLVAALRVGLLGLGAAVGLVTDDLKV